MTDNTPPSSMPNNYTWLVPVDTRAAQCLHVCIKQKENGPSKNVVVSDYECLHGHRASQLMADMVSSADTHYHIDIVEPPQCHVLSALEFMHADSSSLDFDKCSALCYAHTAHFLHMQRLSEEVIICASDVVRDMTTEPTLADKKIESTTSKSMSPWDAIAILTLLGDTHDVMSMVNLKKWYIKDPKLFESPTLFSSCSFFGPQKFADIIKMINETIAMEKHKTTARQTERTLATSARAHTLSMDLMAVVRSLVGRSVVASKRSVASVGLTQQLYSSTGTIVDGFIHKDRVHLMIEWHTTATKSTVTLTEFLESGSFRLRDMVSKSKTMGKASARLLKENGAMKYT